MSAFRGFFLYLHRISKCDDDSWLISLLARIENRNIIHIEDNGE